MKVIALLNWGLGLEILKILGQLPDITMEGVVTGYCRKKSDPWKNAVHDFAVEQGFSVTREENLSMEGLRREIREKEVDLLITHAFMKILPERVFSAPKMGTVNIHPSLLPLHRGPSPLHHVLREGMKETGLTSHYMDRGVDTGDIIHQVRFPVEIGDTIPILLERQKGVIEPLIRETISRISDREFRPRPQDPTAATYAPRP